MLKGIPTPTISTGVSGLGTGVATFLGTPSSANLAATLTDETGTGTAVFATSPALVSPSIGDFTTTVPSSPSTGLAHFTRFRAGKRTMCTVDPDGIVTERVADQTAKKACVQAANGHGSSGSTALGQNAYTATGTVAGINLSAASYLGMYNRVKSTTAASAASSAGWVGNNLNVFRGSTANTGGFFWIAKFVIETSDAASAVFAGLYSSLSDMGDVDPSTLVNICGFSADTGDTTMQWIVNDGTGTATKVDLGANFPKTTGTIYEARIFCKPNDTVVYYSLERFDAAFFTEGSSSSNLPVNSTGLTPQLHIGNRATASAMAISFQNFYTATEI